MNPAFEACLTNLGLALGVDSAMDWQPGTSFSCRIIIIIIFSPNSRRQALNLFFFKYNSQFFPMSGSSLLNCVCCFEIESASREEPPKQICESSKERKSHWLTSLNIFVSHVWSKWGKMILMCLCVWMAGAVQALNMNQKRISLTQSTVLVRIQTATTVLNFHASPKKK